MLGRKHDGDYRAMPAYLEALDEAALKFVGVYPKNPLAHGLPLVMGVVLYIEPKTGRCLSVMEARWLTAMRTGASGGVGVKYLSRPDSRIVGIYGAGVQARTQLMALCEVRKIDEVRVYDIIPGKAKAFAEEMGKKIGVMIKPVENPQEAAEKCDIIISATPSRKPIVMDDWIEPGTHINALGADALGKQELDPSILKRVKVVVDDVEQAIHGGEVNVPISQGIISRKDIYGEMAEVVLGHKPGRTSDDEITVFDSTGLVIHDVIIAGLIYRGAKELKIGVTI
ncbi:MAG: ornithine cyclodeaminase family protein [Candidatus Bathyarchaeota archaeon]